MRTHRATLLRLSMLRFSVPRLSNFQPARRQAIIFSSLFLCSIFFCATAGVAQNAKSPADVKLDDLGFICGHNRGELDGAIIDEHWSEVGGDTMIGMFRQIKNGKAQMYEFLTIEQTPAGPVLRLKHFDPGLVGWEEKAQAASYPLVSWKPNEATFERPDKTVRLTFRSTSKDTLDVLLEHTGKKPELFQYAHSAE
jgi:Domain of unknown function (DUF6265)